ncbi:MAG: 23S rRNA (pseudouridine(1915)-N(3))-methyltransferase RlmH [Epsilonproteobacteria bacterium]|nr:23S rRNA (pseudouridine(1915)-N(3))-methyltransferase RlmH [Campylobacterota bacterium]
MQINVYSIEKKEDFKKEIDEFIKKSAPFAKVTNTTLYSKSLAKSQNPKAEYSKIFQKYLDGFNIILTPEGKLMDSHKFAALLEHSKVNFFIAGAYGFEEEFKKKGINVSLTPLTLSHKIAKLVLFEQIYRGLSINNNHPYHK